MKKTAFALCALMAVTAPLAAQQRASASMGGGDCADNVYNCAETTNPLPAPNTVWIEEMTWMDVRDALEGGARTVIVPTGGVEPNGPWLATGKHNYVLRANCDAIARDLGDALCAPVVKWVPEGQIDPPTGHMRSPGTISMRQGTFEAILEDVARSLRAHGFRNVVFIGDSGGNQRGQEAVAARLNAEWDDVVVAHVPGYYDYATVSAYMRAHGLDEGESDALHDDAVIALNMFADDPFSIRYEARAAAGEATINGVSLADRVRNERWASAIVGFRGWHTARLIESAIIAGGTVPPAASRDRSGGRGSFTRPEPDLRDMGGGRCAENHLNCADTPNPLPPVETSWIEEMTWMDVRDALDAGKTTVIIATGGVEPNGPFLATGKHQHVLRAMCPRIAEKLGNALCAPVFPLVPEGSIDPPSGHMTSPGTISLRQETFEAALTDMAESLHRHGFANVVFIGDSGGNQRGMERVAAALNDRWGGSAAAHFIPEYYAFYQGGVEDELRALRIVDGPMARDGLHDDPYITLTMMLDDVEAVRWSARVERGLSEIDGVDISDLRRSLEWGHTIAEERARVTAEAIRARIPGT